MSEVTFMLIDKIISKIGAPMEELKVEPELIRVADIQKVRAYLEGEEKAKTCIKILKEETDGRYLKEIFVNEPFYAFCKRLGKQKGILLIEK